MEQIGFRHGCLVDDYEVQANKQGYTLGNKAEFFSKVAYAYNLLRINGFLTDRQADSVCLKIQKKLAASVKRIEGSEDDAEVH